MRYNVITTHSLTRVFDGRTVVDSLELSILSGEIFGLLGPNGAGKTTIIKILITLLAPTSGTAEVAGFNVQKKARQVRQRIGYVPQLLSADSSLTAYENLKLSARLYGMSTVLMKNRIKDSLKIMELQDFSNRQVKTFSGGMIRRLELAQAMLHHPSVLFLDEPTIGLDPVARRVVWDRLKELQMNFGMTILLTTHDMDEADHLCERIAIIDRGRIAVTGTPAELKARVSANASLNEVFTHFSSSEMQEGSSYRDTRNTRVTASRLG